METTIRQRRATWNLQIDEGRPYRKPKVRHTIQAANDIPEHCLW